MKTDKTDRMDNLLKNVMKADIKEVVGTVSNETRKGIYVKIRIGLSTSIHFVGSDENGQCVVECVA